MPSILRELPFTYAVSSAGRRCGSASAFHEPSPAGSPYRDSSIAPAGLPAEPPGDVIPPRRSPKPSTARVRLHLKPGQKGTKQLLAQYGDRLIRVRYRYDAERKKRLKTVELLVEERDWQPPGPPFAHDQIVALRVAFTDVAIRDRVKQAGGRWNPERRVWQLSYDRAVELGLNHRILDLPASNTGCQGSSGKHLHADTRRAPHIIRCSHPLLDASIPWQMPARAVEY